MITLVQSLNDNIKQRIAIAKYNVWFEAWKICFYSIFNFDVDDLKYKFNPFSQYNFKIVIVHHFVCFVFCSRFLHLIWCHRNSSNEKNLVTFDKLLCRKFSICQRLWVNLRFNIWTHSTQNSFIRDLNKFRSKLFGFRPKRNELFNKTFVKSQRQMFLFFYIKHSC